MTIELDEDIKKMTGKALNKALPQGARIEIGKDFRVSGNYVGQILNGTVAKRKNPSPATLKKRADILKKAREYLQKYRQQVREAQS
jgi:hypothetical protein